MEDAMQRLNKVSPNDCPSVIARYDYAGVCPYTVIGPLVQQFAASRRWFEAGAIGFTFLTAPSWYIRALSLYESASARAMKVYQAERASK